MIVKKRWRIVFTLLLLIGIAITAYIVFGGRKYTETMNMQARAKYLVVLSREMKTPARFLVLDAEGNKIDDALVKGGQAIFNSVTVDDGSVFFSLRKNYHYFVDKQGNIHPFSFLEPKYGKDFGAIFVSWSGGWLLGAMNIGNFGDGYQTELIYRQGMNGELHAIELHEGYIGSAVVYKDKLYAHCSKSIDAPYPAVILGFDLATGQQVNAVQLANPALSSAQVKPIKLFGEDILVYGDSLSSIPQFQRPPCLGIINTRDSSVREINFAPDFIPMTVEPDNDKLYVIGGNGVIKVFDNKYNQLRQFNLADNALDTYKDRGPFIQKTVLKDGELYVLYRFVYSRDNIQFPAAVHIYDIETGNVKKQIKLTLPGETEWWAEALAFQIIN